MSYAPRMLLHGVDFSGADGGGLAKIRVVVRDLDRPGDPVRSEGRFDRRSLLRRILGGEGCAAASPQQAASGPGVEPVEVWRIDAPFGLPLATMVEHDLPASAPEAWVASARWMRDFGSPRAWRSGLRAVSRREPRRVCDEAFRTPMAPMNLRVFKQTWTLIGEVLLPLAEAGVRIEPVWRGDGGAAPRVVVCEGCPASVLTSMGLAPRGYKGGGEPPRAKRSEILKRLGRGALRVPPALQSEAIADDEGDLLDAILLTCDPFQAVPPAEALVEGWVY